jgi:outer membrane protein insertion porin family
MPGRVATVVLCLFLFGVISPSAFQRAAAAPSSDPIVAVAGNRHTDAAMIRGHFHAGAGGMDAATLDAALKSLYATGLFEDVKISQDGDHILVTVIERPAIDKIAFEGNKKIKDEDLKKAVQSRAGGPLSHALVHDDVAHIIDLYRQHGYFEVGSIRRRSRGRSASIWSSRSRRATSLRSGKRSSQATPRTLQTSSKGVIKTGETNFLSFLLDNDNYDADRIENDCELVRRFYLAHGYADVRVRPAASYDAARKVVVTFAIDEGAQYRLGRVDIISNVKSVDADRLRAHLRMQPGETYDADAVNKTAEDIAMALAKSGAPFANALPHSERVPEQRLINLVYTVEEGKRLYVERIEIHGNSKTRDDVIRREFEFAEGDAYNRALIDRGKRRLEQLGYFKTVKIGTQPGSAPDRVVVDVTLDEQKTGEFFVSGGYSAAVGASATVTVGDTNFLGTGDTARASATLGQYVRAFDVSVTDPYALGPRLSLGLDLFGKESLANSYQSYVSTLYGAKILAGTPISDQLGVSWSYAIYNQGLSLDPALGTASLPIQQAAAASPMWVSSVGSGMTYSTLDNTKNPMSGVRVQSNNEFAGLGGAAKFARTTEDARYYHQIFGDVVGIARAQTGYATPWGGQQLPLLNGFFGGPQLVRGFAPNGFGPRDVTPGTTQDNVGGNIYWTTSAELQAPVPFVPADAQLKAALFSDAGSLWATNASSVSKLASLSPSQQIANSNAIRASVGGSLIWASPFGALRVDYAYPIAKQPYDVTQRLNFTAGAF